MCMCLVNYSTMSESPIYFIILINIDLLAYLNDWTLSKAVFRIDEKAIEMVAESYIMLTDITM